MSQQSNPSQNSLSEDVQQIRDILFGEEVKQLVNRMEALEQALRGVQKENSALRQALEAETSAREGLAKRHKFLLSSLGEALSKSK